MKNIKDITFIVAAPRSGTTWLTTMLKAHPAIFCSENRLFGNHADLIQSESRLEPRLRVTMDKYTSSMVLHLNHRDLGMSRKRLNKELLEVFIDSLWQLYLKNAKGKQIVDKITPYCNTSRHVLCQIERHFPKNKMIYLLRDGRDVCTSGAFNWLKKYPVGKPYSEFEKQRYDYFFAKNKRKKNLSRFFTDWEIEEWANTWAQPLHNFYIKSPKKVYLIRYEDMLVNSEDIMKGLFAFMGVDHSDKILGKCIERGSFRRMSGRRKRGELNPSSAVRKGIRGDWKNYFTKHDGELFDELAGKYLIKLGYEKDGEWYKKLPQELNLQ